ncbi:MAG: hypothetical protein ACLQFR_08920 [Streptosporangiaceae bacterium]
MTFAVAILAIALFLAGPVLGFLLLIIIGIRTGDRARHLADSPHTHAEAMTRRVLGVGTRNHSGGNTDEEA